MGAPRNLIPEYLLDVSSWPSPDISVLTEGEQMRFLRIRDGIILYAAGKPYPDIEKESGVRQGEIVRLIKRCVIPDATGSIIGLFALVSGARLKGYTRVAPITGDANCGYAGALSNLFERFPELEINIQNLYFGIKKGKWAPDTKPVTIRKLHDSFKKWLKALGVGDEEWPFCVSHVGYSALAKYCKKLDGSGAHKSGAHRFGKEAARRLRINQGIPSLMIAQRAYSFLQLDYQKVDAASIIKITNEYGKVMAVNVSRWHYGMVIDERYGSVLGMHIALEKTPSADDALETVASALFPSSLPASDFDKATIPDGCVLLHHFIPELNYQCFAGIKMDNAWANLADDVVNNLISTVGCAVNFGQVGGWWRRNTMEKIFGQLTRRGPQRLSSSYGNGPGDVRIDRPAEKAVKFEIEISEIETLIRSVSREHNVIQESERLQHTTPVEAVRNALARPACGLFRQPLPMGESRGRRLFFRTQPVTVRGSVKKGERPYFKLDRIRHTNGTLKDRWDLIGKTIISYTNRRLAREVYATDPETGETLGKMEPGGGWDESVATLRDRQLFSRSGLASRSSQLREDPLDQWIEEKAESLSRTKGKANADVALKLARVHRNLAKNRSLPDDLDDELVQVDKAENVELQTAAQALMASDITLSEQALPQCKDSSKSITRPFDQEQRRISLFDEIEVFATRRKK